MSEQEEWRSAPGFPGYEVSNRGRILSRRKKIPRVLAGCVIDGYRHVHLRKDGRPALPSVHSLVAAAFIGERPAGLQIRHLDGDRSNNQADNLAYGSASENMRDRVAHGRHQQASKTECLRGHAYTQENTIWRSTGWRSCRTCKRASDAASQVRRAFRAAGIEAAA